jgi:hypothetical protein
MENSSSSKEALDTDIENLCRLLACFDCPSFPVDLFIRGSRSKPTWAANGELAQALPASVGVPTWLVKIFGPKAVIRESQEQAWLQRARELGVVELISECGVQYLQLATDFKVRICAELNLFDRRKLLSSWLSICIHAFPSKWAEISGEEMEIRFLGLLESSILPLLAVITDEDIIDWVCPKER